MNGLQELLLRKGFSVDYEIITSIPEGVTIPDVWKSIINTDELSEKRAILTKLWQPMASRLPKTLHLITNNIEDAFVVREGALYSLVYIFSINNRLLVWVGFAPTDSGPFMEYMDEEIAAFYKEVHNGWYEKVSGGLGFLALEQIEWLEEHEWGILDDIPPLDFELTDAFYIFHNAGPGYLCINITDKNDPEYLIFWTDRAPKRNIPFWSFMDAWIEIGLVN